MTRAIKVAIALPVLLVLGLCGAYLARNPEQRELTDTDRATAPGASVRLGLGVTQYELREPASGVAPAGRTAVLVHGFSVPSYIWDSTAIALAQAGVRVLRYDLYGRGFSDRPDARYDAALFTRQLSELLDSLRIADRVDLMGLSMGGWVTATFVATHPQRVRTLTLVDAVAEDSEVPLLVRLPGIGPIVWQTFAVPGMPAGQLTDFVHPERFPDWADRYVPQMQYRGFGRALRSSAIELAADDLDSVYARAGRTGVPVLILWGREDAAVPLAASERIRRAIPGAELVVIDSAGHLPHIERADMVNPVLLRFLSLSPPAAASPVP
jgi:pimeloyl-ACP methyl ester carboxylesterase